MDGKIAVSDFHHHVTQQTVIGTGWVATGATLLAMISPDGVKEWAALAQVLAIGGFTMYLTLRKQYEQANATSLLAKIDELTEELTQAKQEREKLATRLGTTLTSLDLPPVPKPEV